MSLLTSLSCLGFNRPVHCLVVVAAIVFNTLLRGIRSARNNAFEPVLPDDVPLRPTCSYTVLIALHSLAAIYLANQLSMLRRQASLAKSVCLLHLLVSLLLFITGLVASLKISSDDDLTIIFAESLCFIVLVSDFSKPLQIVKMAEAGDSNALSLVFTSMLTECFLDLLMQLLIISLGILFSLPAVLRACTYASLSLISTFISFYLIVPSVLSIALSIENVNSGGVSEIRRDEKDPCKTKIEKSTAIAKKSRKFVVINGDANPIARRMKFIMSAAILLVHAHSKLQKPQNEGKKESMPNTDGNSSLFISSKGAANWSDFDEISAADWGLTLVLAVVVCLRFLLFSDSHAYALEEGRVEEDEPPKEEHEAETRDSFNCESMRTSDSSVFNESVLRCRRSSQQISSQMKSSGQPALTVDMPNKLQFRPARQRLISDASLIAKSNEEIIEYYESENLPLYTLEAKLMTGDEEGKREGAARAVAIRRGLLARRHPELGNAMTNLPHSQYDDFATVVGACCENVVGTVPLPVGLAGPLLIDGVEYQIPMATTEGCLVASVNRGCKVLSQSGGVTTVLLNEGMTRAPVVKMPDIKSTAHLRSWLKETKNFDKIKTIFNGTSRFCRLTNIEPFQAGCFLYIRFVATTGDAMGMNMVSRACEAALSHILSNFPECRLLSLSGNVCSDKKAAAVNWLMGRGKTVISEAVIDREVVCNMLRTTPENLVKLNTAKNLIGSAVAGATSGGFNAHAANILAALYIATGQDVAQVVESSNCITILEVTGDTPLTSVSEKPHGGDLHITCTLPTLEVGTVGGGTVLSPQKSCLDILGVSGSGKNSGDNARQLAKIAAAGVLAGELSLLAALATNQLMPAHLRLNRSQLNMSQAQLQAMKGVKSSCDFQKESCGAAIHENISRNLRNNKHHSNNVHDNSDDSDSDESNR